jgi:hypothetical protein
MKVAGKLHTPAALHPRGTDFIDHNQISSAVHPQHQIRSTGDDEEKHTYSYQESNAGQQTRNQSLYWMSTLQTLNQFKQFIVLTSYKCLPHSLLLTFLIQNYITGRRISLEPSLSFFQLSILKQKVLTN